MKATFHCACTQAENKDIHVCKNHLLLFPPPFSGSNKNREKSQQFLDSTETTA